MKKSFLLCTLSSVLFYSSSLSYALSVIPSSSTEKLSSPQPPSNSLKTPPEQGISAIRPSPTTVPPTGTLESPETTTSRKRSTDSTSNAIPATPSTETEKASSQSHKEGTLSTSLTTVATTSASGSEPQLARSGTEKPNSETDSMVSREQHLPKPNLSEEATEPTTKEGAKSRRRPILSSSTPPVSGENSTPPSTPPQSMPENSASAPTVSEKPELLQRETVQPTPEKPTSIQEKPVKSDSTPPVSGEDLVLPSRPPQSIPENSAPTPTVSEKPVLLQRETVQPTPEKPASVQEKPAKSELEKPLPKQPEKQPEKPKQIEIFQHGVRVQDGQTVTLHNPQIYDENFAIIVEGENSLLKMIGGTATANFVALDTSKGGTIDATDIVATAQTVGLISQNGTIKLKGSIVNVTGRYKADGIVLKDDLFYIPRNVNNAEEKANARKEEQGVANRIFLENTKVSVEHGTGISAYSASIKNEVTLKNSQIHADILLKNESGPASPLMLTANHSLLQGRVRTLETSKTVFDLKDNTTWLLKANKNIINSDNDVDSPVYEQFGVNRNSYSNLSMLNLTDSTIMFEKPEEGHYQTLFIGYNAQQEDKNPDIPAVYSATGSTAIHVNTKWSGSSPVTEQETDRIMINGDVSGTTMIHINLLEKDKKRADSRSVWGEHMTSLPTETHGISIIQVSGKANENSFKLAGDYMTMGGLPYKYTLTAYKPGTSHASQNLFGKNDQNFWDFRLQNAYLDKDKKIRALLPQVANYLVMPNALFSAGLTDVNNQNTFLNDMRLTVFEAGNNNENNKNGALFLSSYGEKVTLSSNRDPLHYGYDADVNYTALQLGVVLAALESENIQTHVGLLGTYGKLAFTPKGMEDSEKTTLDKWSLTAYSGIQHSSGLYVNALLSYGAVKGNITTALVGNAAKLDGTETLNVSATIGQQLATGSKGLVFEPQAQLIYQNLFFKRLSDANGLEVDMNNPRQWLVRIGGRLTQAITTEEETEETNAFSFYGKLNILKAFGENETIKIVDAFYLDPTGSSIEGGIGVNAFLSENIVLHGDISYRQKLQKAGVSGTSFSGGVRYYF
ncbi:autotransporter outer membrane beta-barrel domain-containing protein [Bartonella machadoae]|nr:autotransporter outer membrane beta-barrel domain-containing protein [Bartonella machadoae]UNE55573.1 autotransporter outer membrane beta-barrel domain-containing protein [Bartonella machadoae]